FETSREHPLLRSRGDRARELQTVPVRALGRREVPLPQPDVPEQPQTLDAPPVVAGGREVSESGRHQLLRAAEVIGESVALRGVERDQGDEVDVVDTLRGSPGALESLERQVRLSPVQQEAPTVVERDR